ncbi:MAG: hypothetical protein KAT43_06250 [Nanoarchaeota archaeon]|nr:hypothetical protein [Nanoarchaeota archaeon]
MAETANEIIITYDILYDVLRREKNTGEIQKLDEAFFSQVESYLAEKQTLLKDDKPDQGLFGFEEKRKLMQQLENVHKILTDIYEWREKKIIAMARDVSRTNSGLANTSVLLLPEKKLYEEILAVLDKSRKEVLINLLSGRQVKQNHEGSAESVPAPEEPKTLNTDVGLSDTEAASGVKIRFTESVPPFMGPDMKEYGPFDADEIHELPEAIAGFMMQKGCAEKVEN